MKSQPKKEIKRTVTHKDMADLQRIEREEAEKKGRKKRKGYSTTKMNAY